MDPPPLTDVEPRGEGAAGERREEVPRGGRAVRPPVLDVADVDELEEPGERERGERGRSERAAAAPERDRAEECERVERRAREEAERAVEEETRDAELGRERDDDLLSEDRQVPLVRQEDVEERLVHPGVREHERRERQRAGQDEPRAPRAQRDDRDDETEAADGEPGPEREPDQRAAERARRAEAFRARGTGETFRDEERRERGGDVGVDLRRVGEQRVEQRDPAALDERAPATERKRAEGKPRQAERRHRAGT